jgi:hypothetical protein
MDKLTQLTQRARALANILSAPIGSAGDDYLTPAQRSKAEAELSAVRAEIESIENEFEPEVYLSPTEVAQFVYGMHGDPSHAQAQAIVKEVQASPYSYLTTGSAGANFERILAIADGRLDTDE